MSIQIEAREKLELEPRDLRSFGLFLSGLGFALFMVVNALLLIRPSELIAELKEWNLYEISVLGSLAIFWPKMLMRFRWSNLKQTPITICVVALCPIVAWSVLWQSRMDMIGFGVEYAKIVLYYLIMVCALDSPARIRRFVVGLALMITVVGLLALLDHYEVIELETIQKLVDKRDKESLLRMQGVGIFADPNDLAQILGVGMVLCVYGIDLAKIGFIKLLWLAAMLMMLYCIYLTKSRGGLLGMLAGLGMMFVARYGVRKALIVGGAILPLIVYAFAGHQTQINTQDDSAQARVQLWSDALQALRESPLFGIGAGVMDEYAGQVAHNSFLHVFAEQGFPGGFLFFLAYFVAIWGVLRLRSKKVQVLDEELAKMTPTLAAALVCYAVGMLSLTRNYVIPTYTMLGLATAYLGLVRTRPEKEPMVWSLGLLGRTFAIALGYLAAMHLFVQAFVRWKG